MVLKLHKTISERVFFIKMYIVFNTFLENVRFLVNFVLKVLPLEIFLGNKYSEFDVPSSLWISLDLAEKLVKYFLKSVVSVVY